MHVKIAAIRMAGTGMTPLLFSRCMQSVLLALDLDCTTVNEALFCLVDGFR